MDHRVLLREELVEDNLVRLVDHAEALAEQAVEAEVGALLRAALDEHRGDLDLLPLAQLELHQLVRALVHRRRRHDRQVDRAPEVDQVLLGEVVDDLRLGGAALALIIVIVVLALLLVVIAVVSEQLATHLRVLFLVLFVLRVEGEVVQRLLPVERIVQRQLVRDLIVRLDNVEVRQDARMLGEVVLALRVEALDHVLHALVDGALVQDAAQTLKDGVQALRRDVGERRAALGDERDHLLHRVVRGRLEQQRDDLQRDQLVRNLLVDEVRDKLGEALAHDLVVALVRAEELAEHALEQQLAHLGHLRVDHGEERGVDMREARRRHLRLHQRADQQRAASDDVLLEEVDDDVLDVGDVHFVHEAVDRLLERLPRHPLVLLGFLVRHLLHHLRQLVRRHVQAPCAARRLVDHPRSSLRSRLVRVLDLAPAGPALGI
mmetsp:Transcript_31091/g.65530  ORF Transcript_31091/g.65530 Transcript_31091/m.65530 type:complete len:434 (-) Transcript_31091:286-1587(-)